ncbi:MAG: polyamine aminopropyltransferase [Microscillaceae bacterium]|nr:polyamine aminopropyltransferase [Microscillaceae bacterium]
MEQENHRSQKRKSLILKISLFATGLSGIVSEYILSTLASYFIGDSILQWTLVLSFMLFSMGLGSRLSQYIQGRLLEKFILIEFILSLLVSFSALLIYVIAAYTIYFGLIIYLMSILIGFLIGLEIPLVTRLNEAYQSLRVNIASVMENDYYGSLLGGLFFAFVGLPWLGLTYTPFVLGLVNFVVASILFLQFRNLIEIKFRRLLTFIGGMIFLIILLGFVFADPIVLFGEQKRYKDQIIYVEQSKYQKIVITQWKNDYWLFINGSEQFSTRDEEMYHEPLVHPVMKLSPTPYNVLVLGGGDGGAVREILKHSEVRNITLVDLDPAMTDLGKTHPVLLEMNDSSLYSPKLKIYNQDAYIFMDKTRDYFDVIIIDLPDPRTVELGRLYSKEFYELCYRHLRPQGVMITQSGSPYFNGKAFECINRSVQAAGFQTIQIHNQILTFGEWGWTVGAKHLSTTALKKAMRRLKFDDIHTLWLNQEAMLMMTSFGKRDFFYDPKLDPVDTNTIHHPVLYRYYLEGNWDLY